MFKPWGGRPFRYHDDEMIFRGVAEARYSSQRQQYRAIVFGWLLGIVRLQYGPKNMDRELKAPNTAIEKYAY